MTTHFDIQKVRQDFPLLHMIVHGKHLTYLDNAATTQMPRKVIERVNQYMRQEHSNVHRGIHYLSEKATDAYEKTRSIVAKHIHAEDPSEIIFVRGTTEAINLVAQSWGRAHLKPGDGILLTVMEHHSNIVPWQLIAEQMGAKIHALHIKDSGELVLDNFEEILRENHIQFVAVTHVSNTLGTINPIKQITTLAHKYDIPVLVDGAQSVSHCIVDVVDMGCDFFAFSGHKTFAPTGIGVLYGKRSRLEQLHPYQGGGSMIEKVTFEKTTYLPAPHRFEAGTPNIIGTIGLGEALHYLEEFDHQALAAHESELLRCATQKLQTIPKVKIIGNAVEKLGILSFTIENIHPHDIATILDSEGVAIRGGHHCTQPLMGRLRVGSTARASFSFYNNYDDVDCFIEAVKKCIKVFDH